LLSAYLLLFQWDEEDANWKKFQGLAKKMVTDSNAVAQEKGLEACLLFVENCKTSPKTAGEVVDGLVNKCVAAPKTRTKELASQICLLYCEVEAHEKVIEQLLAGLTQKNPKVVSGCVAIVTNCLAAFGAKVIKVSPLLKAILPLLDNRDKEVRDQGKRLIVESYRWIGDVMKSQLTGLKPVQLAELETEFANLEGAGRAKPERWLRSAGPPRPEKGAEGGDNEGAEGEEDEEDSQESNLDPYELLDPVDILSKLPKNFFEQVPLRIDFFKYS
jgi:cytoskeleton-associated protein 5